MSFWHPRRFGWGVFLCPDSGAFLEWVVSVSVFARSDLMSVSIPVTSGGCGETHSRPVRNGAPARIWELTCAPCETYLKGSRRVIAGYKNGHLKWKMDHDPHWSATPADIPFTPDEERAQENYSERGAMERDHLQTLALARIAGVAVPETLTGMLTGAWSRTDLVAGTLLCPAGHENPGGVKFCGQCGESLYKRAGEISDGLDIPVGRLDDLHVKTLQKLAREQGLSPAGKKEDLIVRLREAASAHS